MATESPRVGGSWLYDTEAGAILRRVAIAVAAVLIFVAILFPLYWMVATAFKTTAEVQAIPPTLFPEEPSLQAFFTAFEKKPFERYILNSLVISVGAGVLAVLVGTPAAYVFSRREFAGKRALMSVLLASLMFPGTAIMVPVWELVFQLNLFNTRLALVLIYGAMTAPFVVWLMKGFFDEFPDSLLDAARVDQCTPVETFRYVIAPLSRNSLIASFLFAFLLAWNELVFALTILTREPKYTVPVGLLDFVVGFNTQWNDVTAASIVVSIPVLLGLIYVQRHFVQGLTGGAIKG